MDSKSACNDPAFYVFRFRSYRLLLWLVQKKRLLWVVAAMVATCHAFDCFLHSRMCMMHIGRIHTAIQFDHWISHSPSNLQCSTLLTRPTSFLSKPPVSSSPRPPPVHLQRPHRGASGAGSRRRAHSP